jgi:rare lipoprotein A (peptidoglycan hydrolase)
MRALFSILFLLTLVLITEGQFNTPRIENDKCLRKDSAIQLLDSCQLLENESVKKLPPPAPVDKDHMFFGIASFYSRNLEGTKTATGETFYHRDLTAASNNFKLNTLVRVTNILTGKSVVVRINDRMHPRMAKKGRIVDLTIAAAKKIGLTVFSGITKVKVEEVVNDL